jgi:acyl carrier protein
MTDLQIKEVVFKALKRIAPEASPESLPPDQNVREALDIDSYDFLMFLISLNEELGVEIPEADYGKLITMDDILSYLSARVVKSS